jgi:hypothetical protein
MRFWPSESSADGTVAYSRRGTGAIDDVDTNSGTALSEADEDGLGVLIRDAGLPSPATLTARKTNITGYTRELTWDDSKVTVMDGATPVASGVQLTEADGDKQFTVVSQAGLSSGDAVMVVMQVDNPCGTMMGGDSVKLRHLVINVTGPVDSNGDGLINDAGNEFVYDSSAAGVLTIPVGVQVLPDDSRVRSRLQGQITVSLGAIAGSTLSWTTSTGTNVADYNAGSGLWTATAQFTGLPANNSAFGAKTASVAIGTYSTKTIGYEVFYTGTATNHPGGTATDPNWFYYYKQNEGGTDYDYAPSVPGGRSNSTAGVPGSIHIGNEAYAGDQYITTSLATGHLEATGSGWSAFNDFYANFVGVLAHERQHANNETQAGPPTDNDLDMLPSSFETGTSHTVPTQRYSAIGVLVGAQWDDGEVYAGGPVEQQAIQGAVTTQDWASPGTNKS